jgi:hypothetical protein
MDRLRNREFGVVVAAGISIPVLAAALLIYFLASLYMSGGEETATPNAVVARRWPAPH